jgi:site-specific recombinase XerD
MKTKIDTQKDLDSQPDTTGLIPPAILIHSGQSAINLYNDYLHLSIRSDDSRQTYRSALSLFFRFCDTQGIQELLDIEPNHVRAYLDHRTKELGRVSSARTHYSAIKGFGQYLVEKQFLATNPAASVKYAFVNPRKGKTPVISPDDVRALLLSIPDDLDCTDTPAKQTDLRDKALIGLMAYTFVRIGGALSARVSDLRYEESVLWLDMVEKGSKSHTLPISGAPRAFLESYIRDCGLSDKTAPLFQSANRNGKLTGKPYDRGNSRRMIADRAKKLGIAGNTKNHTFRATGITHFLEGGGRLDDAQDIANHSDSSTTRRYDRRSNQRLVDVLKQVDY